MKEEYKSLYLKKRTWRAIKDSRGWHRRGSIALFAKCIGITRQYAGGLVNQELGCSTNAIRKIVDFLGIKKGECWCHLFEMAREEKSINPDHPLFNFAKHAGEVPYKNNSLSSDLRKLDYDAEER